MGALLLAGCAAGGSGGDEAKFGPSHPSQYVTIARASRESGDFPTAARLYQKAIDAGDDTYETREGLAVSLAGSGALKEAEAAYRKAALKDPAKAEPQFGLGRLYMSEHKASEALVAFEAGIVLAPRAPAGWNGKGIALDMLGRHAEAQVAYRTGLAAAPDDKTLKNNYGLSLAVSGKYDEAVKILTELVQEPGATSRNRQNLALALGLQGDMADARVIAKADLSEAAVENNLKFYAAMRGEEPNADEATGEQ